jgi:hypothetical protein
MRTPAPNPKETLTALERAARVELAVIGLEARGTSRYTMLALHTWQAGEQFERPYPDSKSRVLPLDDPASHLQRNCFHAPDTHNRSSTLRPSLP